MTSDLDSPKERSANEIRKNRAYQREFWPGITLYGVLLSVALGLGRDTTPKRVLLAAVPVVPFLLITRAIWRSLKRSDEYVTQMQLSSMAAGFGAAMFAALLVWFVGLARVELRNGASGAIVFSAGMATWAIASAVNARRTNS